MYKLENKTVKGLSPLTINKTAENKMRVYPYGYTEQETRNGYNMVNLKDVVAVTANGITASVRNGIVTLNGTSTAIAFINIPVETPLVLEQNILYQMYAFNNVASGTEVAFRPYVNDGERQVNFSKVNNVNGYLHLGESRTLTSITIRVGANITLSNVICKPMIIQGDDTTKPFEQYGASPSPDFPSDIRNVGDNIQLFDKDNANTLKALINGETKVVTTYDACRTIYIPCLNNEDYTISRKAGTRFIIGTTTNLPSIGLTCNQIVQDNTATSLTISTTDNDNYLLVFYYYSGSDTLTEEEIRNSIKIEKGSKATSYSEYGCGNVVVKVQNQNFLQLTDGTYTRDGITAVVKDGKITANGTATAIVFMGIPLKRKLIIPANEVYLLQAFNTTIQNEGTNLRLLPPDSTAPYEDCVMTSINATQRIEKNIAYTITHLMLRVGNGTTVNNLICTPQLVLGEVAKEYKQGEEQTVIFPLAEGQLLHKGDYLAEDGIHQVRDNYEITGEENWILDSMADKTNTSLFALNTAIDTNLKPANDRTQHIICNSFITLASYGLDQESIYSNTNSYLRIRIKKDRLTSSTATNFKAYLQEQYANGTPVIIEYELATERIIPYTEEQEYILNHIYSYEETTNIDIISEFETEIDVEYTPQFLQEIKDKFIKGPTFGRIHITDTNEDFTQDNYLKDFSVSELRFVPDKGLFGGCVAKKVDVNFNNVNKQFSIQDKEFEAYLGVDYEDERYEIKYGTFIVQHPETEDTTDNTSFTALDYMIKFNQKYIDYVTYPCTLRDIAESICNQAGVTLAEEKFRNEDFIVENNQFVNGENLRQVLQGIALSAFSWARIDENNELHFDLNQKENIDIELSPEEYYNLSKDDYKYGPINRIIIRDSQIEGENVTIEDKQLQGYPVGKNLLNFKNFTSQTINGLTITNNEDGSITLNGTTTDIVSMRISDVHNNLRNGKYYLSRNSSGTVEGGTFTTILYGRTNGVATSIINLATEGAEVNPTDYDEYYLWLYVASGRTFTNYVLKPQLELGETKTNYEPFIPAGICELVIEDSPFAYTQEKREQLIEAGKELFGFRYMPINDVSLIGLAFLNTKDKIRFKTLDGEVFDTYLFDHTINYNGVILDNVQSKALTKTETKYIYKPDITQAIKNTQIIVDKANQTINQIIEKQDEQSSQLVTIETDLSGVHTTIEDNKKGIEEKITKIEQSIEGTKQTLTYKGGNNIFYYAKEFWNNGTEDGTPNLNEYTDTEIQQKSISGNGYIINKGTSEQKNVVKNDTYTISFTYKKLIDLATGYVDINGTRINLTSTSWKEEVITEIIDTNTIDIKIVSDTANAFKIFDLMGAIGNEKQVWTQNPNETRTDTVTIGKGIQVNSSTKNTYARFDADGNRIYNSSTNEVVTELTDKGVDTDKVTADVGQVGGILIQVIDGQTWFSSLL